MKNFAKRVSALVPVSYTHLLHLMALQHGLDLFHVGLGLVVLHLHGIQLVGLLREEAEDALFFILTGIKALQLTDQAGDHIAHFAQILGALHFPMKMERTPCHPPNSPYFLISFPLSQEQAL